MASFQCRHDIIPGTFDIRTVGMKFGILAGLPKNPLTRRHKFRHGHPHAQGNNTDVGYGIHTIFPFFLGTRRVFGLLRSLLFELSELGSHGNLVCVAEERGGTRRCAASRNWLNAWWFY